VTASTLPQAFADPAAGLQVTGHGAREPGSLEGGGGRGGGVVGRGHVSLLTDLDTWHSRLRT
jgi:hypothetical protein